MYRLLTWMVIAVMAVLGLPAGARAVEQLEDYNTISDTETSAQAERTAGAEQWQQEAMAAVAGASNNNQNIRDFIRDLFKPPNDGSVRPGSFSASGPDYINSSGNPVPNLTSLPSLGIAKPPPTLAGLPVSEAKPPPSEGDSVGTGK